MQKFRVLCVGIHQRGSAQSEVNGEGTRTSATKLIYLFVGDVFYTFDMLDNKQ